MLEHQLKKVREDTAELAVELRRSHKNRKRQEARVRELEEQREAQQKELAALREKSGQFNVEKQAARIAELRRQVVLRRAEITNMTGELNLMRGKHADLLEQYQDPSVQHFLRAKAAKLYHHPGIEGAANKTFTYVLPATLNSMYRLQISGEGWMNATFQSVEARLRKSRLYDLVGSEKADQWVPILSGVVAYGLIFLPISCTIFCVADVVCRLGVLLRFGHLYLAIGSALAAGFALKTSSDPLQFFAGHDAGVYLFSQYVFGILFVFYSLLIGLMVCAAPSSDVSDALCYRALQLAGCLIFGMVYYFLVWTPAMVDDMPQVEDFLLQMMNLNRNEPHDLLLAMPYFLTCGVFSGLYALEELSRRGERPTDEKDE